MNHHQTISSVLATTLVVLPSMWANDDVPPAEFHGEVASIQMLDAQTGWATGHSIHSAALLRTHDGGKSWTDISARSVPSGNGSSAITFQLLDAKHGWAAVVGEISDIGPTDLYSTEDGGYSWQHNSFKTKIGAITSIQFTDASHGFILVESDPATGKSLKATYRTADGGATWQTTSETSLERRTDGALPVYGFTEGMVFRNAKDGWITGSPRGNQDAFFFRTKDGGESWQPQTFDLPQGFDHGYTVFHTPWFFGEKKIDGVLSASFIQHDPERDEVHFYTTQDGGEHWRHMSSVPANMANASETSQVFLDAGHGLLTTSDNAIR